MLKFDFDSEVFGLVYGYLFYEQCFLQLIVFGEVCVCYQVFVDDKVFIWLYLNFNYVIVEKWLISYFLVVDFFFEEICSGLYIICIE